MLRVIKLAWSRRNAKYENSCAFFVINLVEEPVLFYFIKLSLVSKYEI